MDLSVSGDLRLGLFLNSRSVSVERMGEKAHRPGLDLSEDVADTVNSKSQT